MKAKENSSGFSHSDVQIYILSGDCQADGTARSH